MTLKDQKDNKKIPTPDDIWLILDRVAQRQEEAAKEAAKRQKEATKRQKEAAKRQKEAAKRQKEAERLSAQRAKEFKKEIKEQREEAKRLSAQRAKEFKEEMKKRQEKSDQESKQFKEDMQKESKQFKEDMKKELNKFRGIWSNAWGDFVETLFSGRFVELIQDWIPSIRYIIKNMGDRKKGRECEFDIVAVNNDSLVATEVKSTLGVSDVKKFLEKLKNFTLFFPQFKGCKIYGAVAFLKANEDAEKFAMKKGLFVIAAKSDTGEILNKKGQFQPRIIKQADEFSNPITIE